MRRRRVEFTIETHERIFVKRSATNLSVPCPVCGVLMITPEQAATLAQVSLRTVFNWIEASRVHFSEDSDRTLMICTASLPREDSDVRASLAT